MFIDFLQQGAISQGYQNNSTYEIIRLASSHNDISEKIGNTYYYKYKNLTANKKKKMTTSNIYKFVNPLTEQQYTKDEPF